MRFWTMTAVMVGCSSLWGCQERGEAPEPTSKVQEVADDGTVPMTGPMMGRLRSACPMTIEGVEVSVSDTDNGVALTFKGDATHVSELRQRVEHLEQMYEMHQGRPMMWHHMRGVGRGRAMAPAGRGSMPGARAETTEVEGGVRLELTPSDPTQLESLREHARWHQQRMQSGACWVWSPDQRQEKEE